MAIDVQPPELAELLDVAERPRAGGWSLRGALVRYAQANPVRVSQVMELVRRIEAGLHPHVKLLASEGPSLWSAAATGSVDGTDGQAQVVGLLQVSLELDQLADALAAWANDRTGARPDGLVDATVRSVASRLDALGVPREELQQRRPRGRG